MLLLQKVILLSHTKYEYLSCLVKCMIEVLGYGYILFTSNIVLNTWYMWDVEGKGFRYRILSCQFSQVVSCLIYFE